MCVLLAALVWVLDNTKVLQMPAIKLTGAFFAGFECLSIVFGIFLLFAAQDEINMWRRIEENALDEEYLEGIKGQYERIYYSQMKQA